MLTTNEMFERRRNRTRAILRKTGQGRPRLSVHRSSKHIRAQIIDDQKGITIVTASTLEPDFRKQGKTGADSSAASFVGKQLAERAKKVVLKKWCLIAVVLCFMAELKHLQMQPAKLG